MTPADQVYPLSKSHAAYLLHKPILTMIKKYKDEKDIFFAIYFEKHHLMDYT